MITMMKNVTEAAMTKKRSKYSQSVKDVKGVELGKGMVCEGVRVVERVRVGELVERVRVGELVERVRVGELVWSEICVGVRVVERVRVGELVWSEICVEVGLVVKLVRVVVVA